MVCTCCLSIFKVFPRVCSLHTLHKMAFFVNPLAPDVHWRCLPTWCQRVKFEQVPCFLQICSHLLKKSFIDTFTVYGVLSAYKFLKIGRRLLLEVDTLHMLRNSYDRMIYLQLPYGIQN